MNDIEIKNIHTLLYEHGNLMYIYELQVLIECTFRKVKL